jgi:membrane protein
LNRVLRIPIRAWSRLKTLGFYLYYIPGLHGVLRCIGLTAREFVRDDAEIWAAAVGFYAFLSLLPFLLLLFSMGGYLLSHFGQQYASQEDLLFNLESYIKTAVPFFESDILQRLREIIAHRQAYGITGLAVLLVTAGLVFRALELAFARVFKTPKRFMVISHMLVVVFVVAIGLGFLAVHYLSVLSSSFYSARDPSFGQTLNDLLSEHVALRTLGAVFIGTLVFTILIKYFTRKKMPLGPTAAAGILFSVLWLIAARLFGYYLHHIAQFSLLYGSLASLAILILWIFYSACVLLICAEFLKALLVVIGKRPNPDGP